MVADGERGFTAEEDFVGKLAKAGTLYLPSAAYAPWQKGQVERKIESFKSIVRKVILNRGLTTADEMRTAGHEIAAILNQRPGPHGVSAGMMLFGQRTKLYGEIYKDGEPHMHHLSGADASSELGRRLQIRNTARQAAEVHFAKEMVRKTVAARTRHVEKTSVGEMVFFYRNYPQKKAQQLQAQRGCYLGPGVVIGFQGKNVWISYAGRCYLVAPEHVRGLAPDEIAFTKPLIRSGLEQLQQAAKSEDFLDITNQEATEKDLEQAQAEPAGEDFTADPPGASAGRPVDSVEPEQTLEPPAEEIETRTPEEKGEQPGEVTELEQTVGMHLDDTEAESSPEKRKAESDVDDKAPVSWQPTGSSDTLKWKKQKKEQTLFMKNGKKVLTEKLKKKMLDKEVPYSQIPEKDLPLYHKAEEKEWDSWRDSESVRVVKGEDAKHVSETIDPARIISLRFVYRDNNASVRTPQNCLPVAAKARLCAQASKEPLAMAGKIKLDSPTVQRIGITIFLQHVVNFAIEVPAWIKTMRKGDISAAFLQGVKRDTDLRGRLFLKPPRGRPLAGVDEGDLLEVIKSVYGLPDAPRAWWEEVTGFLRSVGFRHARMDVAFMVYYKDDNSVGAMLILHVDDLMVATDGSPAVEKAVEALHEKYPFGEWEYLSKNKKVTYTGRDVTLHGQELHLDQESFVKGRMEVIKLPKEKNRPEVIHVDLKSMPNTEVAQVIYIG